MGSFKPGYFAGEFIITDGNAPFNFSNLEGLPLEDTIKKLAKEYRNRVELLPVQIQREEIELNLGTYLDTKSERYIFVLNRTTYPENAKEERVQGRVAPAWRG